MADDVPKPVQRINPWQDFSPNTKLTDRNFQGCIVFPHHPMDVPFAIVGTDISPVFDPRSMSRSRTHLLSDGPGRLNLWRAGGLSRPM